MAGDAILHLENVVAGYGRMTILNGLSATIRRGTITTVIGPNGAGKSTLFKTVFGLLGVRSGKVTFDGRITTGFAPRRMLDAGMCYVPQGRNLFAELSVRHNLELVAVAGVLLLLTRVVFGGLLAPEHTPAGEGESAPAQA
jgi:branched-chain amino acid transport system ATP-binding protein